MLWSELLRVFDATEGLFFQEDNPLGCQMAANIEAAERKILLRLLAAAGRIGRDALAAHAEAAGPYVWADEAHAHQVLAEVYEGRTPDLDTVLEVFLPTTVLYPAPRPESPPSILRLADSGGNAACFKGLCAVEDRDIEGGDRDLALGDVFFVPPVGRAASQKRRAWIEARDLGLPPLRGDAGPYWRLGSWNQWRLQSLGWPELLILGAGVATRGRASVVVAPPRLVPRIGFVPTTLAAMGHRVVVVPLGAVPDAVRDGPLAAARQRHVRGVSDILRRWRMFRGIL